MQREPIANKRFLLLGNLQKPHRIGAISALCLLVLACGSESELDLDAADVLIHNAKIYTVSESNPWAQAAAIEDGRFVYVGGEAGVHAFHGPETLSFDLAGKMVLPGLIDSHTHPGYIAVYGNEGLSKNLPYPATQAEILAWLEDYAAANPEPELILTGSWQVDIFGVEGPRRRIWMRSCRTAPSFCSMIQGTACG